MFYVMLRIMSRCILSHHSKKGGQDVQILMWNKVVISWSTCGLADQRWVHLQKLVDSSPITVNVLCPLVRHFTISTPLDPGIKMGTGNIGMVTGLLWRRCIEPNTTENKSSPFVTRGRSRPVFTLWRLPSNFISCDVC